MNRLATLCLPLLVSAMALGCTRAHDEVSRSTSIVADDKGFTPSHVAVAAGAPVTLTFTRTSDATCAKEVVFPEANVKADLPLNEKVAVNLPSGPARTLTFQCGMGMFKGTVIVE